MAFEDIQEKISDLIGSDMYERQIELIKKHKELIRELKLPNYKLPDIAE